MSRILITLTSHSDSHFERSNTSFSENKLAGVDLNSNRCECGVRMYGGKIMWVSTVKSFSSSNCHASLLIFHLELLPRESCVEHVALFKVSTLLIFHLELLPMESCVEHVALVKVFTLLIFHLELLPSESSVEHVALFKVSTLLIFCIR